MTGLHAVLTGTFRRLRRSAAAVGLLLAVSASGTLAPVAGLWASAGIAPTVRAAALVQPPEAVDEFVPVEDLPAEEGLPAAPLLIAAYTVVWVVAMLYLFSIWRRLGRVEQEIADVSRRIDQSRRR